MHPRTVSERENTDRIIPFGYPTIPGGASGGASVDPTPPSSDDPVTPTTLPYDLDSFRIVPNIVNAGQIIGNVFVADTTNETYLRLFSPVKFQGIIPKDLTGVKQIGIEGPVMTDERVVFTADGEAIPTNKIVNKEIANNLTFTITQFLDTDDFSVVFGNNNYQSMAKADWNSLCAGKQIVLKYPVTVTVYDTAGEELQQIETEIKII